MSWKNALRDIGVKVEHTFDDLRHKLQRTIGYHDPIRIQPYRGYGTADRVKLLGRVLEDDGVSTPAPDDRVWDNVLRMFKRMETDEIPSASVRLKMAGADFDIETDDEGYFQHSLAAKKTSVGRFQPGVQPVEYELLKPHGDDQKQIVWPGEVFIPRDDADFIVVSDIDDTVLHTHATSMLRLLATSLFTNEYKRIAFPGVAEFYQALARGPGHASRPEQGEPRNNFFYLTSSMWNVYDMLALFFDLRGVPKGPLLMRDLGLTTEHFFKSSHGKHKLGYLRELLNTYPNHQFVLLGDTGQKDAEIYFEIACESADRLKAVYLRDVAGPERDARVAEIVGEMQDLGVPALAAERSLDHARHAADLHLIDAASLAGIEAAQAAEDR
ncbi:MAG: phosphatase domain-containing protein, partial [Planctomycetota bacterium]